MMGRTVLVTGVSRLVGGLTAQTLAGVPDVDRVIAVDSVAPARPLGGAQFVRADIRNPIIGKIMIAEQVDTVVHLGVILTPRQAGGRVSQKEINVMGTMQLLAACQRSTHLERVVVKSSTVVYGASPRDPAKFTEQQGAKRLPSHGFGKDTIEVENYVRSFARRRADVSTLTLRMANVVGRDLRTAFGDLFSSPLVPLPLGYDGRFQVLHLNDAIACLQHAALRSPATGTVNVAADGLLTMRQAVRLAGKPFAMVPPQAASLMQQVWAIAGIGHFDPDLMSLMCFGRAVDTTRMRETLGYEPMLTTRQSFERAFAPVRADITGEAR